MAKITHPMYGYQRQDKNAVVIARISEGINYLNEVTSKNFKNINAGSFVYYDTVNVPKDQLRCNETKCHMTGTLWLKPEDGKVSVSYSLRGDYEAGAFGFGFVYINYIGKDSLTVKAIVSDIGDLDQKNATVYQDVVIQNFTQTAQLAQFDFSDLEKIVEQRGEGWQPSNQGINITFEIEHQDKKDIFINSNIGISNIKTIADRSELKKSDNVLLSCLSTITPNVSVDAADARCFGAGYDAESTEVTMEIEATMRSYNDFWLNPLETRGSEVFAALPKTQEFVIQEKEVDGRKYGYIKLSDLAGSCNSVIASLTADCGGIYFEPLSSSRVVRLEPNEMTVIYSQNTERGDVYFNAEQINKTIVVTYDADVEVTHYEANQSKLQNVETEFIVPVSNASHGKLEYYKFVALVTEHSQEFNTEDEVSLALTLTIQKRNGKFYDRYVIEAEN